MADWHDSNPSVKALHVAAINPSKQLATTGDLAQATVALLEGHT